MPNQVSMGAMMTCTFGAAPSSLVVLPKNKVLAEGAPAANIMDRVPLLGRRVQCRHSDTGSTLPALWRLWCPRRMGQEYAVSQSDRA
jgi:hypothetical protein